MKKFLIATTLLLALTSCFWKKEDTSTQSGSTTPTTTGATVATGTTSETPVSTGATASTGAKVAEPVKEAATKTETSEKVELNAASDKEIVNDLEKDIDNLLIELTKNDTKK